ncbi:MAG: PEP-CTERM sorting domain-containing protein [candidate division WS1 bacterium]|jgi:hypothetical protein|nr:PEP-CTERM sorting domain-containing protein [candidate division WS1 bacterium]
MGSVRLLLLVVAVLSLQVLSVSADVITVDGDDSDWLNPDSSHDDPLGDVVVPGTPPTPLPGYDLDWTYYSWDADNGRAAFMGQTAAPTTHTYSADFVEILINADDDLDTGGEWHEMLGADYRVWWDYDGVANEVYDPISSGHPVYWDQWVGGSTGWQTVAGLQASDVLIAWGNMGSDYSVIEVTLNPSLFGNPDAFTWGMYLDNGTTASDDASPDRMDQRGYTPEPTTFVLLPLGLAALAGWRRRTRQVT